MPTQVRCRNRITTRAMFNDQALQLAIRKMLEIVNDINSVHTTRERIRAAEVIDQLVMTSKTAEEK